MSEPSDEGGGAGPCPAAAVPSAAYWLCGERLPLGLWLARWRHLAETHPATELGALWDAHKESRRQIVVDVHFAADIVAHLGKSERIARARGLRRGRPRPAARAPRPA